MNDFGKAVRDRLREAGGAFVRHGKGDHDVWTMADGKRGPYALAAASSAPDSASSAAGKTASGR